MLYFLFYALSLQAASARQSPSYSFELQGGFYQPADPNWASYYGSPNMLEMNVTVAKRFMRVIDVGISTSFAQDMGKGRLPESQLLAGEVSYEIFPLDFFAVLRLGFSDKQWVVPYAGGGYTRFFYRQSVDGVGYARGSVDAMHAKAGLQLLLDVLEPRAARKMLVNYGVLNSYFLLEGKIVRAQVGEPVTNLGGISYRLGILLEY